MRLEQVEIRRITLPLRLPFETSFGRTTTKQFLLVSVSADGVTGHAECVADVDPFYLPETNATALHVLRDFLAPHGLRSRDRPPPRRCGPAFARVRGHEMAKAALEMAVWELVGAPRGRAALAASSAAAGASIEAGVSVGLQEDEAALAREGRGRGRGRLPPGEGQDQAGPRRGARGGAARALPASCP